LRRRNGREHMPLVNDYDRHTPIHRVVATGSIKTNAKWPLLDRLKSTHEQVIRTVQQWAGNDPVLIAVEFPPIKRRPPSAKFARQSTSGDKGKNKGARQDYCRRMLKAAFLPEHLPPKGSSSDIADAMLIAEKVAAMTAFSKGRVIAFDPSLTSTGWAVVQH
jgi:hypothetical protein